MKKPRESRIATWTGFAAVFREVEDVDDGGVYVLARCRCEAVIGR
jgi:hypothetical protein